MLAANTESIFPKLELAVILIYFIMLPKIFLPSMTPCSNTIRSFSNKIISADSFAISTAVSTEIPTSASFMADASLIPSPINPTVWPFSRNAWTIRVFCSGESFANTFVVSTTCASCESVSNSISEPSSKLSTFNPTWRQIQRVTASLSPVNIFVETP